MLEVSPLDFRFSLDNESKIAKSISLKNTGEEPISVRLTVEPSPGLENSAYGRISEWITFSEPEFILLPGESKNIFFTISIPDTRPAGGQYATIFAETVPASSENKNGIDLITRVGIRLCGSSSSDIHRNFSAQPPRIPTILVGKNLSADITVQNSGNIDFSTTTFFSVSSIFGKQLYSSQTSTELLPDTTKEIYNEWGETPALGIYRLDYSMQALDTSVSASRLVFVISPLFTILLCALILSSVILALARLAKRRTTH
ncbi:hypothetical protein IKE86_01190 [Candidatus Saccharibacteria bacterium]|nr:hypothetical protein [Candidatus Saccharibacteria bacterium]